MQCSRILPRVLLFFSGFILLLHAFNASAYNRLDALDAMGSIKSSWQGVNAEIWINDLRGMQDGGVLVGDPVDIKASASEAGYLLFILIDAKGAVSIFRPSSGTANTRASFAGLVQDEPVGEQFLYSVVSKTPFPSGDSVIAVDPGTMVTLPGDERSVKQWADALNLYAAGNSVAISQPFSYFVDSDTAVQTRGMKIGLKTVTSSGDNQRPPQKVVTESETLAESTAEVAEPKPTTPAATQQQPVAGGDVAASGADASLRLDIRFALNESRITSDGKQQLDVLGDAIISRIAVNQMPTLMVEGHTDSTGEAGYNELLSQQRADAVKQYLMNEFSIPADLLRTEGWGEARPVDSNATAAGRKNNRRVELKRAVQ